jgi:hypothetical protein
LPAIFGRVTGTTKTASDAAFHRLVARFVGFYSDSLLNEHWGESIPFGADITFTFTMAFQGMDEAQAASVWRPFLDWITSSPRDFVIMTPIVFDCFSRQTCAGPLERGIPDEERTRSRFFRSTSRCSRQQYMVCRAEYRARRVLTWLPVHLVARIVFALE